MGGQISGFDHAIVGVADLESARLTWQRLGFTTCSRGKHIGWGTANYCIMFCDDYLELLGIVDASRFTNNLDRFLAEGGEGLLGMAFGCSDVGALAEQLGGQPQDLKRLLELPGGVVEPRFKLLHPPAGTLPGLSGFFCQHLSPHLMRRPEWLIHANGAQGIAAISVGVDDVEAAQSAYANVLGADFVSRKIDLLATGQAVGLCRLSIAVADLQATAHLLVDGGISFQRSGDGLAVDPQQTMGVALSFVEIS